MARECAMFNANIVLPDIKAQVTMDESTQTSTWLLNELLSKYIDDKEAKKQGRGLTAWKGKRHSIFLFNLTKEYLNFLFKVTAQRVYRIWR